MWFVSTSGRKFLAKSIKFLGLWLFVCVLWLTFTNNTQPAVNRKKAAKQITDSVTSISRNHSRHEINTRQGSMKGRVIIASSPQSVHTR